VRQWFFSLTVVLRFIGTEEQAQAVETMVDDLLNKTLDEIRQEIARMKELSEANGCETMIGYTNSRTVEIQITSPRSIRFLAIIREFDQLIAAMDTLWLACIIDDTHYAVEAYQWKRKILRLADRYGLSPRVPFWLLARRRSGNRRRRKGVGGAQGTHFADH
jgi:hypothetical protein